MKDPSVYCNFIQSKCFDSSDFPPSPASYLVLGRGGFGFAQVWQEHGRTAGAVQFGQVLHD